MWTLFLSSLLLGVRLLAGGHAPVVIVVDPGHGGIDGGTRFGDVLEKDLVLDLGLRLEKALEDRGYTVEMTRRTDTDVSRLYEDSSLRSRHRRDLVNRNRFAKEKQANVFVSLHLNHSRNTRTRGAIVFYHVQDPESFSLAREVQHSLNGVTGRAHQPHKNKSLFLLKRAVCPTILIEYGFLSNADEREQLMDPAYRDRLAERTAEGITQFLAFHHAGIRSSHPVQTGQRFTRLTANFPLLFSQT